MYNCLFYIQLWIIIHRIQQLPRDKLFQLLATLFRCFRLHKTCNHIHIMNAICSQPKPSQLFYSPFATHSIHLTTSNLTQTYIGDDGTEAISKGFSPTDSSETAFKVSRLRFQRELSDFKTKQTSLECPIPLIIPTSLTPF